MLKRDFPTEYNVKIELYQFFILQTMHAFSREVIFETRLRKVSVPYFEDLNCPLSLGKITV